MWTSYGASQLNFWDRSLKWEPLGNGISYHIGEFASPPGLWEIQ